MHPKTYPKHGYIGLFKRGFGAIFNTHPNTGILGCSKRGFGAILIPTPNTGILGCGLSCELNPQYMNPNLEFCIVNPRIHSKLRIKRVLTTIGTV
jgi:hypothetical protein